MMLVGVVIPRSGDAGYLILDNQQCTDSEIQNHPASRNQYPGSINTANGFYHDGLHPTQHFMQLWGYHTRWVSAKRW